MDSSSASADALIDLVFAKLSLTYGREFLGRWEGFDMAEVKADWRRELHGWLQANPLAIRHALENLPAGKPPDVLQFRDLCSRRPDASLPALPAPKADPDRVRREIARLKHLRLQNGPRYWAHALKERDKRGDSLTIAQRVMYREALKTDDQTLPVAHFRGVDPNAMPEAMRPRSFEGLPPIHAYDASEAHV